MELFSLRWNDYLSHVTYAFDSLRNEEDLIDVTLSCERKKLKAHKMLLSACSPYFREIFNENPCQHPVIVFRNMKYTDLESIVNYIYKGEVSVQQDQLASFLETAQLLEVKGLSGVENSVDDSVTEKVETATFAQQNDQNVLQNKSLKSSPLSTPVKRSYNKASSQVLVKEERVDHDDSFMSNLEEDDGNMGLTQELDKEQNDTNCMAQDHLAITDPANETTYLVADHDCDEVQQDKHYLEKLPGHKERNCEICAQNNLGRKRSRWQCPGCDIGVHPQCYPYMQHYKRFRHQKRRQN